MLGWLKDLWARRRYRGRALFRFWDGSRWRYIDPWATWRALFRRADGLDLCLLCTEAKDSKEGPERATSTFLEKTAEAFGVERWSEATGRGLTDGELRNLFLEFWSLTQTVKKNGSDGETSSQPTDSASSTSTEPPSGPESAPGPSTCSETESSPAAATSSPPPSAPPAAAP